MTPKKLPTYERLHEIFEYKNGMLFFSGKDFDSLTAFKDARIDENFLKRAGFLN